MIDKKVLKEINKGNFPKPTFRGYTPSLKTNKEKIAEMSKKMKKKFWSL